MNKITLVTLGVNDLASSTRFYQQLGFDLNAKESDDNISIFNTDGTTFSLYPIHQLAADVNVDDPPPVSTGFSGIALAYNTSSKESVDDLYAKLSAIGGNVVSPPSEVFWGGYHFYFTDLDGHYWEVAYVY
ncbi:MAG: VOC family protein [Promicromonosporaceae bacterium]|nr:VOC family protein [Promicromonosporaceae bacterium]